MQKLILLASGLAILFFTLMWLAFPFLNNALLKQLSSLSESVHFVSSSMGEEFTLRLKNALSFGAIPFLSLGSVLLIRKVKNPEYPTSKLVIILVVVLVSYLIGFLVKFLLVLISLDMIVSESISQDLTNSIPLSQVSFYEYGLVFSLIAALLMWAFVRKKLPDSNYANTL